MTQGGEALPASSGANASRFTHERGGVVWFTGLPSAGKTTLSRIFARELRSRGLKVEVLDGDEVRETLSKGLGFTRDDRNTNIRRIGYVAQLLARYGVWVLVAVISPYRAVREEVCTGCPTTRGTRQAMATTCGRRYRTRRCQPACAT